MLIPTSNKRPLPKEHSYPIGAQAISDALVDVPQFAHLDISFYTLCKIPDDNCPHFLVLAAEYRHWHVGLSAANFMIENGWYEPRWHLVVYAVPRNIRRDINNVLFDSGLPIVAEWLSESRTDTWLDSSHCLELEFNPQSSELIARNAAQQ